MNQKKKALCLASVASNLDNFNRNNVKLLLSLGYDVTLASNFHTDEDSNSQEKIDSFISEMEAEGVKIVQIDFTRKLAKVGKQIKSYSQVKELINQGHFDLIHCHTPICAAITRLAAKKQRKKGTKVFYTAHGFHFFSGAPIKNWVIYYPIEKWLSRYTDVLFTINNEDYNRAKEKFHAVKTVFIPGIGVDTSKFKVESENWRRTRGEFGIDDKGIGVMLLSVGEVNDNKNHVIVIKALSQMKDNGELPDNLYYVIVGQGEIQERLKALISELGLQDRVKLAGYRKDVADFYGSADAFVFPSFREGLSVSLMEAMASGLPVLCSKIRGNVDLIDSNGGFFMDPKDESSVVKGVKDLLAADRKAMGEYNSKKVKSFDISVIEKTMIKEYEGK